jgi:hypothetical protein
MRALLFTISVAILLSSCANVTSPTGGPKDTIPPILKSTIPTQGQTNYNGSRIMLEFNEWLKLKNPKEEIIITPVLKDIKYTTKKNQVWIDFDDKLLENTTYSISFRESIQDLNEGNAVEDLHLAFSTGKEIDSLQIAGIVFQLLTGQPSDKTTVAVFQSDTFDIFKHKPVYFTRTNKKGEFKILNLKAGYYNLYAFDDKNKNLLLESRSERFGKLLEKINLNDNVDTLLVNIIPLDSRPIAIAGIRSLGHFTKIRFNKNLTHYKISSLDSNDKNIRHCFSASQSEIDIFPTKPAPDSTLIKITAIDSLNQTKDSTFYIKQTTAKSLKEKIKITISKTLFIEETQKLTSEISSTELLKSILADSIYILADTINRFPISKEEIFYDTIFRKIRVEKTFQRKDSIKWKSAKLIIAPMAFTSIYGDSSKQASASITYLTPEETAVLIIESHQTKSNTIIQILDDRGNLIGSYPHNKVITIKNISPVTLLLRAISDTNNNGKWDAGNPNKNIPPESITYYINPEGKRQVPLRANWEVNLKWNF